MSSSNSQAQILKEEGNSLFVLQEWTLADIKYSEAILLDDGNAILYANRAACRLATGQYLDAATDATKATEINPSYSKAWSRLASAHDALSNISQSIYAWGRALNTLPEKNPTPAELRQRVQYQHGLEAAQAAESTAIDTIRRTAVLVNSSERMPWDIAETMMPNLRANNNPRSSAWIILDAHQSFCKGVATMKALKEVQGPDGTSLSGTFDGLDNLTNAITADPRSFHIDGNFNKWIEMCDKQARFEAIVKRAWPEKGPEFVMDECRKRLRSGGWDNVRGAVTVTIRTWILKGFLEGGLTGRFDSAVEFYSRAIEVLNWGRTTWRDIAVEKRGVVFENTFLRALRSLYLEVYMQAYACDPGLNSKFPLENLLSEADDLDEEIDLDAERLHVDPAFFYSFYVYPKACALSMKAYYHSQIATLEGGPLEDNAHTKDAASYYIKAAALYLEDDEKHPWSLNCALGQMIRCGTPLAKILVVMEGVRVSFPKMKKIWASSAMARQGGHGPMEKSLVLQKDLSRRVARGELTLQQIITAADTPGYF